MAHEALSVKLHELDEKISRIYSRLLMIETADHDLVRSEKKEMLQECESLERTIKESLQNSESPIVAPFCDSYDKLTEIAGEIRQKALAAGKASADGSIETTERKILMAEYALDFAVLSADHALLFSLDALDAMMTDEESEAIVSE